MSGFMRPTSSSKRHPAAMRPPQRPVHLRAQSATPTITGRASPADSITSSTGALARVRSPPLQNGGGVKRKERDFEREAMEETNINVVVRCRGRNDREVRENSGVVVSTDGVRGNTVELSMGPNAINNKTYHFDRVFSQAADQEMVFDDVVTPILDEVLAGLNCTIFAYGQTGTGKTYTMSGNITDQLGLSDDAGIIPRLLYSLFRKLDADDSAENSVKCSFIELYNEELRDLLSPDDNVKLKIYEDGNGKGARGTLVQGMEESHIQSASKGIQLLRKGSHKRQVAATKCNDLSSRSHTIFTVTVYVKRTTESGEELVGAGKLNLVDLAGSENIQRSGAENKRATEAGLINKSLLTLGRVINALVDKSSHIPYRESKLTRLLQDSLGGRTKTCIIATLSPAKSNLEETISTLDYAFRAKNIRNKPQVNQLFSKKTLLKEFTSEIEKLKGDLIATRQRNGVYLTADTYEEITTESESRRILSEEQRDKIETMEANLRNKVQELFILTSSFSSIKKEHEMTKTMLDGTKNILFKTEAVLAHTHQSLTEETALREAHQRTETELAHIGSNLITTLGKTTSDLSGLHSKLRRRSDLQHLNRNNWSGLQSRVVDSTSLAEQLMDDFRRQQEDLISALSTKMESFVSAEMENLKSSQAFMEEKAAAFKTSEKEINEQNAQSRDEMNTVLEEIRNLRQDVKEKVGAGLDDLSAAAQRISAGIVSQLDVFHTQVHTSYSTLGREFKTTFDELVHELNDQKSQIEHLRCEKAKADQAAEQAREALQMKLASEYEEEKKLASSEREATLAQVAELLRKNAEAQESRWSQHVQTVTTGLRETNANAVSARTTFNSGMDACDARSSTLIESMSAARDAVKSRIKTDFATANDSTASLRTTAASVHDSTLNTVQQQMSHMDRQLHSFDEIVSRVRAQNSSHHDAHTASLASLGATVQTSYQSISAHLASSFACVQDLNADVSTNIHSLESNTASLAPAAAMRQPLAALREDVESQQLQEYIPTGETPQRITYSYPNVLPRTEDHRTFRSRIDGANADADVGTTDDNAALSPTDLPDLTMQNLDAAPRSRSPTKGLVFTDDDNTTTLDNLSTSRHPTTTNGGGLRELDPNTLANLNADANATPLEIAKLADAGMPPMKRQNTHPSATTTNMTAEDSIVGAEKKAGAGARKVKGSRKTVHAASTTPPEMPAGRENAGVSMQQVLSKSVGAGGSGTGGGVTGSGRRLRSRE